MSIGMRLQNTIKTKSRRLNHGLLDRFSDRWLAASIRRSCANNETLETKIMDDATLKHFMAWLEAKVRPEERLMVSDKIFALLADDPGLLDDHSWTQLRDMAQAW